MEGRFRQREQTGPRECKRQREQTVRGRGGSGQRDQTDRGKANRQREQTDPRKG